MDQTRGIEQIKQSCQVLSVEMMRLHPAVGALQEKAIKDEFIKALFELTQKIEAVKKLTRKAELSLAGDTQAGQLPPEL